MHRTTFSTLLATLLLASTLATREIHAQPAAAAERFDKGGGSRVLWRFTGQARGLRKRPAVAPDGTIYAQDTDATLYALSASGELIWSLDLGDVGNEGPVVVGLDGTVYAPVNPLGPDTQIVALAADGTVRWTFTDSGGQGLIAGPTIGPDGNLYAVTDQGGVGAFSLTPDGAVRWSAAGDPPFAEHGQLGIDIVFGPDRLFVNFDEWSQHPTSLFYGLGLDGDQLFAVGRPLDPAQGVATPQATVVLPVWSASAGKRLGAYDFDGNLLWTAMGPLTNSISAPDVGPDGTIYVVRNLHELHAFGPDGQSLWMIDGAGSLRDPVVSPDGSLIVISGSQEGSGPAFVKAFATDGGALVWEEVIPNENGAGVLPWTRPLFSQDGSLALVGAEPLSNPDENLHFYLYAFDTGLAGLPLFTDGFEAGDVSAWTAP